eukprot:3007849-Amphidinium_carterae.1
MLPNKGRLVGGGRVVMFSPCIEQVERTAAELRRHRCARDTDVVLCLQSHDPFAWLNNVGEQFIFVGSSPSPSPPHPKENMRFLDTNIPIQTKSLALAKGLVLGDQGSAKQTILAKTHIQSVDGALASHFEVEARTQ